MSKGNYARRLAYNLVNGIQRAGIWPGRFRARIARLLGHKLSAGTFIAEQVFFDGAGLTTEGVVSINTGCHVDAVGDIHIEDGVRIGCGAMLLTTTHMFGGPELRAGETVYRPVRIGRGTWIGARSVVLPGVVVASGCIIAAGAVVAKDTEPNGLYAGVPARRIKELSEGDHAINPAFLSAFTKASNSALVGLAPAA